MEFLPSLAVTGEGHKEGVAETAGTRRHGTARRRAGATLSPMLGKPEPRQCRALCLTDMG